MNFSIFDLYQPPTTSTSAHIGPYVYRSRARSPPPPSSPPASILTMSPVRPRPSLIPRKPTLNLSLMRDRGTDWDLKALVETLKDQERSKRDYGHRGSNVMALSHSYVENQRYWKSLRKKMKRRPDYQHRSRPVSLTKPPLSKTSSDSHLINSSFYLNKLKRTHFHTRNHKEEALRALGFSMRSWTRAENLRGKLLRQEGKIKSLASPNLTPLASKRHEVSSQTLIPRPARFTLSINKPPHSHTFSL